MNRKKYKSGVRPARRRHEHGRAVRHLKKADARLASLIEIVGPCRLEPDSSQSPFHALVRSIVYQQLSGKAAASILAKVKALYPGSGAMSPGKVLRTPDAKLRGAGLSAAKTLALKDLAQKAIDGVVPTAKDIAVMESDVIIERLCQIRGVGPWTVEMLLIFNLGRMDILPVTDYGVRKGFAAVYKKKELPTPKELHKFGERWKPFRTVAAWYLWRSLDLPRQKTEKKR